MASIIITTQHHPTHPRHHRRRRATAVRIAECASRRFKCRTRTLEASAPMHQSLTCIDASTILPCRMITMSITKSIFRILSIMIISVTAT